MSLKAYLRDKGMFLIVNLFLLLTFSAFLLFSTIINNVTKIAKWGKLMPCVVVDSSQVVVCLGGSDYSDF